MTKEHAGGTPEVGFISVDDWSEESFPVPITQFDFSDMDKTEDLIKEAVFKSWDLRPLLTQIRSDAENSRAVQVIAKLLSLVVESEKPRMMAHAIIYATGMDLSGQSGPQIAKLYGVSKQAFDQEAKRLCDELGITQSRTMRDETARKEMSERNYRRQKVSPDRARDGSAVTQDRSGIRP